MLFLGKKDNGDIAAKSKLGMGVKPKNGKGRRVKKTGKKN